MKHDLSCPRQLDAEEIKEINFDEYSVAEIQHMINCKMISEKDVVDFYNNQWWSDVP